LALALALHVQQSLPGSGGNIRGSNLSLSWNANPFLNQDSRTGTKKFGNQDDLYLEIGCL
jgi:hypothetical protein